MDPREAEGLRRQFRVEMHELATGLGLSDLDIESLVRSYLPEVEGPYVLEIARDGATTVHTDHQDPITKRFHTTWTQRALPFAGALADPYERAPAAPQRAGALSPVDPLAPEIPAVPTPALTDAAGLVWIPAPDADDAAQRQLSEQFQLTARIVTENGPDLLKRYVALEEAHSTVERPEERGEIARVRVSAFSAERARLEAELWTLLTDHLGTEAVVPLMQADFTLAVLPFGDRPCTVHVFERDGRLVHSTRGAGWTRQDEVDVLPAPFQRIVARARSRP
jgi:hypothetical protein